MMALRVLAGLAAAHVAAHALRAWQGGAGARLEALGTAAPGNGQPLPAVTVILPAWNDADALAACFPALSRALARYPASVQLLVVAGGPDGSLACAQRLLRGPLAPNISATALPQSAGGKNAALNAGLRDARHDMLVFLDADTTVEEDWLPALVAPLTSGQAQATTGQFRAYTPTGISAIFELEQLAAQRLGPQVTLFGGGSIALTRAILQRIGGMLPEDVLVGVDWDLSERLKRTGARLRFCEGARVTTEIAQSWREYWRGEVRWRRAYLRGQARHLRRDRQAGRVVGLLYLPALQAALLLGWLAFPAISGRLGQPRRTGLRVWVVLAGWILGRHALTCVRVYAFTRDRRWLRLIPVYLASFVVSSAASWRALITLRQGTAHFKGQRLNRAAP